MHDTDWSFWVSARDVKKADNTYHEIRVSCVGRNGSVNFTITILFSGQIASTHLSYDDHGQNQIDMDILLEMHRTKNKV